MALNDARRDRKAEAGTALFGGEKRIKEPLLDVRRDTYASIFNLEEDTRLASVLNCSSAFADPKSNGTRIGSGANA